MFISICQMVSNDTIYFKNKTDCSETRAAELGSSLSAQLEDYDADGDEDMTPSSSGPFSITIDPAQARLEKSEANSYILAKSFFDCREFERCTAIFLPSGLPEGPMIISPLTSADTNSKSKSQARGSTSGHRQIPATRKKQLSEKALFISLYSKYLSGEKKKEENQETILGPADKSSTMNQDLPEISKILEQYFTSIPVDRATSGWLEYLYGIVLAKGKNDADAKRWLIRSVNRFPFNWGAWLELCDLINSVEEVRIYTYHHDSTLIF